MCSNERGTIIGLDNVESLIQCFITATNRFFNKAIQIHARVSEANAAPANSVAQESALMDALPPQTEAQRILETWNTQTGDIFLRNGVMPFLERVEITAQDIDTMIGFHGISPAADEVRNFAWLAMQHVIGMEVERRIISMNGTYLNRRLERIRNMESSEVVDDLNDEEWELLLYYYRGPVTEGQIQQDFLALEADRFALEFRRNIVMIMGLEMRARNDISREALEGMRVARTNLGSMEADAIREVMMYWRRR